MDSITAIIKDEVLIKNQEYINEVDDFDYWNEHIKLVVHYAIELARKYGADLEIVELGALLHDISLVSNVGTRQDHHIHGAGKAVELLTQFGYDKEKMELVRKCVLNHRSSHNAQSIEEVCVADADILAHFANIPMIFQVGFRLQNKTLREVKLSLRQGLQDDFDDLSERTKQGFREEYNNILNVLIKNI